MAYDVVAIVCAGAWDVYGQETLAAIHESTKRIATLAVVGEGFSPCEAATLTDLSKFQSRFAWTTNVLDSGFKLFGRLFDARALPYVMVIDARTMEIARSPYVMLLTEPFFQTFIKTKIADTQSATEGLFCLSCETGQASFCTSVDERPEAPCERSRLSMSRDLRALMGGFFYSHAGR